MRWQNRRLSSNVEDRRGRGGLVGGGIRTLVMGSEQRVRWFRKGFESGDMAGGDTFGVSDDQL